MKVQYTHKTESDGASYSAGYRAIIRCACDCPACAFKAGVEHGNQLAYEIGVEEGKVIGIAEGIKEVVEWVERNKKIKLPKYQLKEWGLSNDTPKG